MNPSKWPKTVNEAVTILVSKLGRDQKAELRGMTRDDLIEAATICESTSAISLGFRRTDRCWRTLEKSSIQKELLW